MSTLAEMVLRVDGTLREDDGDALAVELLARDWRALVKQARIETSMTKRFRFALLACSAKKADRPSPARALYVGDLFKLSLEIAERQAEKVLILSAKHGVVQLDHVLSPYDERLPTDKHRRATWGAIVATDLLRHFGVKNRADIKESTMIGERVLCLAPQSYVSAIGFMYGIRAWSMPLKGLGIGAQKQWLKTQLEMVRSESARPAPATSPAAREALHLMGGGEESPEVPATSSTSTNVCTQEPPCVASSR
ncbi:MAG: DUF6884 domain-containing protein [Myxococcota bacterium]